MRGFLAEETADLGRGHAEHLIGQIGRSLETAGISYSDLDRIVVSTGPGSFTGVRVGLSVARGLALSLNLPVVGITSLEAGHECARQMNGDGQVAVILDAKRNQAYYLLPGEAPSVATYEELAKAMQTFDGALCGSGAKHLADLMPHEPAIIHDFDAFPAKAYASLGKDRSPDRIAPEPLYLRSADAKPQSGFALQRAET